MRKGKHQKGSAVKGEGNNKATKITRTQKETIEIAENIAQNQRSDTKIHGKDGNIQSGNSYSNEPYPPKIKSEKLM